MSIVRAVSFDFWNTFAIPNPKYAEARTRYLYDNFGFIKDDYTKIKNKLDYYAETNGLAVTPRLAISMLFPHPQGGNVDIHKIYDDFVIMFKENPPTISGQVEQCTYLLTEKNINWGITSNTNFIGGDVLTDFIETYSTIDLTNCQSFVFSDIVGVSKPDSEIFATTVENLTLDGPPLMYGEVIHIGDNLACDVNGANAAGLIGKLIKTPSDILDIINSL